MIRQWTNRISRWFNDLRGDRQVYYYLAFCALFLVMLWLSIRFIGFDAKTYSSSVPRYIGKPSGPTFTDSLKNKKH